MMRDLPAGTVTLLFTDIEGSTRLQLAVGERYAELQAVHRDLLRAVFVAHHGHEVDTQGDALFVAFARAGDAVAATVAGQRTLAAYPWPDGVAVQVRMGLHTGDPQPTAEGYVGIDLNRGARICSAAHGGQILLSHTTANLAAHALPAAATLRDLGAHRLKDLPEPEQLFQVVVPGLPSDFPPPRTPGGDHRETAGRSRFVGRAREVGQLRRRLAGAEQGTGGVVLIAGDAGIGKTRAMEEVAAIARPQGFDVLWGRCYEGEGAPAFWPWVQVLRDYIAERDPAALRDRLGAAVADIAQLLPELRATMPDAAVVPIREPEQARFALFDSVAAFLGRAAGERPLLIVLDDLHWADHSSLLLLSFVARSAGGARLLILGAYRHVEVERDQPLAVAIAALRREAGHDRVLLGGLGEEDVVQMVETLARREIDAQGRALASALHRETEGNPFFVQETLRHLVETGRIVEADGRWSHMPGGLDDAGVPEGVHEVIARRLSRLSTDCLELLTVAAVLGREFDLATLARAADLPDEAGSTLPVLGRLEEAEQARLVAGAPGAPGRYRFAHALVRETLYAGLGTAQRIRLHRRAGEAMEATWSADTAMAELAHHFLQAALDGDAAPALRYAMRAAAQATERLAYEEGVRLYREARAAVRLLHPPDPAAACDVLLGLGDVLLAAGEPRRAVDEAAPEALSHAERLDDRARASRACQLALEGLFRYGVVTAASTPEWREWAERAARYAEPGSADEVRAHVALSLHYFSFSSDRAWELSRQALADATRIDDPELSAVAAFSVVNWPWRTREQWDERLRLAAVYGDGAHDGLRLPLRGRLLFRGGVAALASGDRERAEARWREGNVLAARTHDPLLRLYEAFSEATLLILDGRLEDALTGASRVVTLAEELGSPVFGQQYWLFLTQRPRVLLGQAEAALQELEQMRRNPSPGTWWWDNLRALYLAHCGRHTAALDWLRRTLDERGREPHDRLLGIHIVTQLLDAASVSGDVDTTTELLPRVVPLAGLLTADYGMTSVDRVLGGAYALLGDRGRARASYEQALAVTERARYRPEAALCRVELAALLRAGGAADRDAARRLLDAALPELEAMAMRPALARALALLEGEEAGDEPEPATLPDGLTMREVEILRLVAAGRGAREIGANLFLSARTVERHIANIYIKIDAHNKAEATAYAIGHRLV
jgi:class 3 adenylate cyclase/DNA-binding CsgD family transcriptional regulator